MKHLSLLLLLPIMLLIGCEEPEYPGCDTKHNYTNGMVGSTGLTLTPTSEAFITFGEMESVYKSVESCLSLSGTGPTIKYISFKEDYNGQFGGWGVFMASGITTQPDTIFINTDTDLIPRNCHSDRETLRHEFVHHLLYMYNANAGHTSEFVQCDAEGVDTCNGVPCKL